MKRLLSGAALAVLAACAAPDESPPGAPPPGAVPVAAARVHPAAIPSADAETIGRRIEEHFAKSLSADIAVDARDIGASDIPGWLSGTLVVNAGGNDQEIGFLVTPDGHYFISGEVTDLTIDPLQAVVATIDLEGRPRRGPADAVITIVEYSDFQCPFCAQGYEILEKEVLPTYAGKVQFYFKHRPLKSIHPWAQRAALATECARAQDEDGYWKLYHALFEHQKELNEDNLQESVTGYARDAGLDEDTFTACFEAETGLDRIERDIAEATAVGANSTPTFFINGRRLEGAQPLETFAAIIDAELANATLANATLANADPADANAGDRDGGAGLRANTAAD